MKKPSISFFILYISCISALTSSNNVKSSEKWNNAANRRKVLFNFFPTLSACTLISQPSHATDRLFKPNPLTNPVLEKIRIWEQDEADNIRYNGELAPGSPKGRDSYAKMLAPILQIQKDINTVDDLIHEPNGDGLGQAEKILSKSYFQKIPFKRIFNNFADNIYYSDPDRANLYLGGGAIPQTEQSISYLLRNEILTNIENLQAEVTYLIKEKKLLHSLETEDLFTYSKTSKDALTRYMQLVPPDELAKAQEL